MAAKHASPLQSLLVDDSFDAEVFAHEPMSRHTTYRIGGAARFFVRVESIGALTQLIDLCEGQGVPWFIAGRGSNLLVADEGFDGVVIVLGRDFKNHHVDEEAQLICTGAAVLLSTIVQEAFRSSFAGLEFAVGTPGTIGGALHMNAGSKDEWIGTRVVDVTTFSAREGLLKRAGNEIEWGYRSSSIAADEVVLECALSVEKVDPFYIRGKMEGNLSARKKAQPLDLPSCGSVFKNPEGASAAKLIDELGLKGTQRGGAQISEKHANFIVNTGNAKAQDVVDLIHLVQAKVNEAYGITLQTEVQFLGF